MTIAICTFNRADLLDRTLDALGRLRTPSGLDLEIIVVNNNCSDHTDSIIREHATRLPIRSAFESVAGKSRAANLAVELATGELVVWTDDDVIVHEDWITEYVAAANRYPSAAFFGGTVEPWFEVSPPRWVESNITLLNEPFALAQHGESTFPLDQQAIVGANMAVRTEVLRKFPFDVSLGPTGTKALRGEETDLLGRLRSRGHTGVWVGSARVRHFISAERLTLPYLWHWYSGLGTYVAHREGIDLRVPLLFGAPRWAVKKYAKLLVKYWTLGTIRNGAWLRTLREAALMKGYIDEARSELVALTPTNSRATPSRN